MSGEDSDSDCSSVIEVSDFEDDEDGDGVSVISYPGNDDEESEDSCGFFSDEDFLDENWNEQNPTIRGDNNGKKEKRRSTPRSGSENAFNPEVILPGKCTLCENLESVDESDLDERCQVPCAEPWCKCGHCRVVSYHMKKYDRICCHELSGVVDFLHSQVDTTHQHLCITLHPKFKSAVLEYGALYRATTARQQQGKAKEYNDRERAQSANAAFVRWIWDRMAMNGHRRIMPPACVVAKIREFHMKSAPVWYYNNFIPGRFRCESGRHCVAATKDTCNIK